MEINLGCGMKKLYKKLFKHDGLKILERELKDCKTILELGCGFNSPLGKVKTDAIKTGVELYEPYIEMSKSKNIHDKYINKDVRELKLKDNSYDAVIALDLIEHLRYEDGVKLIENMERWAKKKVIIYTPSGFLEQHSEDGNNLQEHISGWYASTFRFRGYKVYGINGLKILRGNRAKIKYKPRVFWKFISDLSQKITIKYPGIAFQMMAVKTNGN